jgi:uncharacterized membrane protein YgaE (UPF0421/DUF939 family)
MLSIIITIAIALYVAMLYEVRWQTIICSLGMLSAVGLGLVIVLWLFERFLNLFVGQ